MVQSYLLVREVIISFRFKFLSFFPGTFYNLHAKLINLINFENCLAFARQFLFIYSTLHKIHYTQKLNAQLPFCEVGKNNYNYK